MTKPTGIRRIELKKLIETQDMNRATACKALNGQNILIKTAKKILDYYQMDFNEVFFDENGRTPRQVILRKLDEREGKIGFKGQNQHDKY